jgi:hypothetical protein
MISDVERTALKEWAVLVDAMARGDILAMVRKGGIRERRSGFEVRHERFLLYPTFFHENVAELAPRFHPRLERSRGVRPPAGIVRIAHLAEAVAVWTVRDETRLERIEHEHGLGHQAVLSRFRYRGVPEVRVVATRILSLRQPVELPEARRYAGCVSWLELDADVSVDGATPVIGGHELSTRVDGLREALGVPDGG